VLGGHNTITSETEWPTVGWENIIAANPDVIVVSSLDRNRWALDNAEEKIKFLKSDPAVSQLDAVKKGHIVVMDGQAMNPTIRTLYGDANMRVRDVVKLGRIPHHSAFSNWSQHDDETVIAALERVDMLEKSDQGWLNLSGGERQRVHIARALAQTPTEILLDEPTNHLDIHHQMQLMPVISQLPLTSIVAIHDLNHASMFCDSLIVMQKGEIVATETPQEILSEDLLWDVFRVKTKIEISPYHGKKHIHFIV
jgi:ABC-type enterochelin transport system ATPase subunit